VAENGQLDDKLEEALALSVQSECPALAAKVTRLNVSLEQLYEKEDIAAEKTDSKPAAGRNQTQMDHRELLYELLHNRTDCADEEHLAILPLSRLDDNDLHMFLSVCPQAGEKASSCQWHETRFLFCRYVSLCNLPSYSQPCISFQNWLTCPSRRKEIAAATRASTNPRTSSIFAKEFAIIADIAAACFCISTAQRYGRSQRSVRDMILGCKNRIPSTLAPYCKGTGCVRKRGKFG
jgi:hypothetical protein